MGLSLSSYVLWVLSLTLEIGLCVLVFLRGASKRLPLFMTYLLYQVVAGVAGWAVAQKFGFWSFAYYYTAWGITGILMILVWLVTAELCFRGFRMYRGIWAMNWRLLWILSALFLFHAVADTSKHADRIGALILVLQRDLAMASAVILVTILIIDHRYESHLDRIERRIAFGLCLYLITVLLSDSLLIQWYATRWPTFAGHPASAEHLEALWNGAQFVVMNAVLAVWCFALRKPLPVLKPEPVLLPEDTYGELSPATNYRLRALNARLIDLLKA